MKAAALACGIAAAFLVAVLVGVGQRPAVPERAPSPINVRQLESPATPSPSPSVHEVGRPVDRRSIDDYDDDHGQGRGRGRGRGGDDDSSGPGSGGSGGGSDNSGSGSGDD